MAKTEHCALCGGELEAHDITDEREAEIRKNVPNVEGKTIHARVCKECGHISYYSE